MKRMMMTDAGERHTAELHGAKRKAAACIAATLGALTLMLGVGACSDRLLRENVMASTQSMIGVQVAQNPQTQVYEAKIGFARNEFFLVPTSKRIVSDANKNDAAGTGTDPTKLKEIEHNQPTPTPNVLAEIMADGAVFAPGGTKPVSVGVYQRLAVGDIAVAQTPAVIALFARDSATAEAAATMASATALPASSRDLNKRIACLVKYAQDNSLKLKVGDKTLEPLDAAKELVGALKLDATSLSDLKLGGGNDADRKKLADELDKAIKQAKPDAKPEC